LQNGGALYGAGSAVVEHDARLVAAVEEEECGRDIRGGLVGVNFGSENTRMGSEGVYMAGRRSRGENTDGGEKKRTCPNVLAH
jgi:hypothetical protein